jgi:NAD(P)-dependent dehydrogenase (short-subunit alcohol dehydrogenase family)
MNAMNAVPIDRAPEFGVGGLGNVESFSGSSESVGTSNPILEGKTLLIAGTTGIAAATAELAGAAGASVFLCGRSAAHGDELRDRLRKKGVHVDFMVADLTEGQAGDLVVAGCIRTFGRIDAAFNVAGISGRQFGDGPAHECTAAGWDVVMNTNARGMFLLSGAILRQMLRQDIGANGNRGTILNMASVLAWSPSPRFFATHAYAASKAAIIGFSRAMAAHYAPERIRINVIAPALVRTPMSKRAQENESIMAFMRTKQPLVGDMLEADHIAKAALFLLSDDSAAVTGDVLTVDGGWCVSEGQVL